MASSTDSSSTLGTVREYYGTTLSSSADLRTDACCDASSVPEALRHDPVLYGECLSGNLYWNDFLRLAPGDHFCAAGRLFHIPELEDSCEDHGQAVIHRGTIPDHPEALPFDKHHWIEAGKVFPVCGNTFRMLADSRLAPHFRFIGDFSRHDGLFEDCGGELPFDGSALATTQATANSGSCC
jgi:arsenite methyltransferase